MAVRASGVLPTTDSLSTPSDKERTQAIYTGPYNPTVGSLYGISLFDLDLREVISVPANADPSRTRTSAEYFFTVPPKAHDMSEPFATNIVHTQGGGKFVESHGVLTRTVTLSGTTGIRPSQKAGRLATVPLFGEALTNIQDTLETLTGRGFLVNDTTIPAGEATGYDDIIFLRNLFRMYGDFKTSDAPTKVVMLWFNAKDSDFWVVEPVEFKLANDSSSPLGYKYSITLRTLTKFTATISQIEDPMADAYKVQNLAYRVQEYGQAIKRLFTIVSTQTDRLTAYGIFAETQLLTPIVSVIQGLAQIKNSFSSIPVKLGTNTALLYGNLAEAIDSLLTSGVSDFDPIIREFRRAQSIINRIGAEPAVRRLTNEPLGRRARFESRGQAFTRRYSGTYDPGSVGRVRSDFSLPEPPSVTQAQIVPGDTIRTVAARATGDQNNWEAIVLLNDLVAPYVSTTRRPGVMVPGDYLLVPALGGSSSSMITKANKAGTDGPVPAVYGTDLRIKSLVDPSGEEYTDLDASSGDFSTISGKDNVRQAVLVKFITEAGQLPLHLTFGSTLSVGRKASPKAFTDFRLQAERTILSDTRVSRIHSLRVVSDGDIVRVSADIQLKHLADTVSTSFDIAT